MTTKAKIGRSENYRVIVEDSNRCIIERRTYSGFLDRFVSLLTGKYRQVVKAFPKVEGAIDLEHLSINIDEYKRRVELDSPQGLHFIVELLEPIKLA